MKRILDLLLASFGMVFFFPLGLLFSLLIKAEDGGPVLYVQERWGKGGKKFEAYKFRTMVPDADSKYGLRPAVENDERVTHIGRFLRATAMDELPQLINILKGDMSFVGPRALAIDEVLPTVPGFHDRHRVRPGLTGPAQVYASRDAPFGEKLNYDLPYVYHSSLAGDLKLLFLSLWVTLRGRWESRSKKV